MNNMNGKPHMNRVMMECLIYMNDVPHMNHMNGKPYMNGVPHMNRVNG